MAKMADKFLPLEKVCESACKYIETHKTDVVCLIIEHDPVLMASYLKAVEKEGLKKVNMEIGRNVKKSAPAENDGCEYDPLSTILQSHTKFATGEGK